MQRVTVTSVRVLIFLINNEKSLLCGADIMKSLSLPSGTVYPLLHRLEAVGWVLGNKEDIVPRLAGRPAKVFYTITPKGKSEGLKIIGRLRV